jgi:fatty acid desaturase
VSDEQTRSLLLVVLGATAVWLWWSGQALNYVRPGLAPYLLAGGVVVLLLGLLPPLGLLGKETAADHSGGHHQHRGRVGWLLLVPVLVVMLVQPAALGS